MNINAFLKQKLKERHMRVDTFIKKCDVSKSTIYRVMKGFQKPSKKLESKIAAVLNFSLIEQQEFHYYATITNTQSDLLSTREETCHLIYGQEETDPDVIELVYYDGQKFIYTLNEIMSSILTLSDNDAFACELKMVNCCHSSIVTPLCATVTQLEEREKSYYFEHLVNFSAATPAESMSQLDEIIPLLPLTNYFVKYSATAIASNPGFFHDFLMIHYSYRDNEGQSVEKDLYLSFLQDSLSACYVTNNEHLKDFFKRNYETLHQGHKIPLNKAGQLDMLGKWLVELETTYDLVTLKPSPCYNRVPMEIYKSMFDRVSEDDSNHSSPECRQTSNLPEESPKAKTMLSHRNVLISQLKTRAEVSYKNKQLDVFTCAGLESLAATGRFSDHPEEFPPFSKDELRMIFMSIKQRDFDKKDSYQFHIINPDKCSNIGRSISVYKGYGLLIECSDSKSQMNRPAYCLINHPGLSSLFSDFAENYVPTMLALPQNEAHTFIDDLIKKYC